VTLSYLTGKFKNCNRAFFAGGGSAMNKNSFLIKFHDANIHPSNIRARDLATVLRQLDESLSAIVENINPGMFEDGIGISLVNIKEGCAALEFDYGNIAINKPAFRLLTQAIKDDTPSRIPVKARKIIQIAKDFNAKYKCRTEFWSSSESVEPDAVINQPEIIEIPKTGTVKGVTDIYGQVTRVGGQRKPSLELKLDSGLTLEISITKELAIILGRRMYEIIGLRGETTWEISTENIIKFKATELLNYKETPVDDAFEKIRNDFGKYFDEIEDVNLFVSKLRED